MIAKMLPPHNMPLQRLSQEEGISIGTLSRWRAEARARGKLLPDGDAGPEGWTAGESADALIHRADQALYAAKDAGRDRLVCA